MIAFLLRRLLASVGVLIAVGLIAFAMFRYVGDPVNQMVGIETSANERAEQTIAIRRSMRWPGLPCKNRTKRSATRFSLKPGECRCSTTSGIFRCISRRGLGAFRSPLT